MVVCCHTDIARLTVLSAQRLFHLTYIAVFSFYKKYDIVRIVWLNILIIIFSGFIDGLHFVTGLNFDNCSLHVLLLILSSVTLYLLVGSNGTITGLTDGVTHLGCLADARLQWIVALGILYVLILEFQLGGHCFIRSHCHHHGGTSLSRACLSRFQLLLTRSLCRRNIDLILLFIGVRSCFDLRLDGFEGWWGIFFVIFFLISVLGWYNWFDLSSVVMLISHIIGRSKFVFAQNGGLILISLRQLVKRLMCILIVASCQDLISTLLILSCLF